ncbi:MAG: FAD-dependent oxidoreductase [Pseudomonadota bacterium]|nr:FAD-dependent oxidoreductase [Pseudomonadota bacterium]
MTPKPDQVNSEDKLPADTEVAIIGGGIIGASAALLLAERGIPTALFEKGIIAGEQSSRNWGWCRQQGRDPRELPLIVESMRLWRQLSRRVAADTGFVTCGIASLATSQSRMSAFEEWVSQARQHGINTELIDSKGVHAVLPGAIGVWHGALYTPEDGRAEPTLAVPAIARAAQNQGSQIFTGTAVRSIETAAGHISGLVTEKGAIRCNSVILAGGAWSGLFCRNLGIQLPQLKVRSSVLRTQPLAGGPGVSTSGPGFAVRQRADGGYTVAHRDVVRHDLVPDSFRLLRPFWPLIRMSWQQLRLNVGHRFLDELCCTTSWQPDDVTPFERCRILNPSPNRAELRRALNNLSQVFPAFKTIQVAERWAGMIDATPDVIPVISTVPALPGLVVATGFSGHGFGIGPAAGQLAAELATATTPIVDPTDFNHNRLIDGSLMTPTTTP